MTLVAHLPTVADVMVPRYHPINLLAGQFLWYGRDSSIWGRQHAATANRSVCEAMSPQRRESRRQRITTGCAQETKKRLVQQEQPKNTPVSPIFFFFVVLIVIAAIPSSIVHQRLVSFASYSRRLCVEFFWIYPEVIGDGATAQTPSIQAHEHTRVEILQLAEVVDWLV
ncbi:hypothetical protein F4823DRAFT_566782 [Ustulina deusta]|nr:hypothetical protein F4823DRAFT_566782 [Ustulina deusta]